VLVGDAQPLVADLRKRGLLGDAPATGEGEVIVVNGGFGKHAAVVVRGGGPEGLRRAGRLFFERIPHLAPERLGAPGLPELATEARRLVAGVSVEGQRARITRELGVLASETKEPCDGFRVHVETAPVRNALKRLEERWALSAGGLRLRGDRAEFAVETLECGLQATGMIEAFDFAPRWEVDRALDRATDALADVKDGAQVEIEVRVSEPPGERATLRSRLLDLVPSASRAGAKVVVRSAWKPAYHYVVDELLPKWRDRGVVKVELAARRHEVLSTGDVPSTLEAPTRLLQELYPADDVVARALGLRVGSEVTLALMPRAADFDYAFTTTDRAGAVTREGFDVDLRERPFSAALPDLERVALWSGVVRVAVDGKVVARERIATDLEELWEEYQAQVLPRLRDLVLADVKGRPEPRHAPWIARLHADATLSEPDDDLPHGLGRSSALDMLHEEIYFHTLGFVQSLGAVYAEKPFEFTGSVVPRVTSAPGSPPKMSVELAPRSAHGPRIDVLQRSADASYDVVASRELRPVDVKDPRVVALRLRADGALAATVAFRCDVVADDRAAWIARHRPEDADAKVFAVDQGVGLIDEAARVRALGARRSEWFAYPGLARVDFTFAADGVVKSAGLDLDPSAFRPKEAEPGDAPIVFLPDDRPLRPREAAGVLATLAEKHAALGLRVYHAGQSTYGRDLWILEQGPFPPAADAASAPPVLHVARRKLAAWKPTLAISAREHANEVSSTTHVLQWLRDAINDDPALFKAVRVVVNPVWNADGAELSMDLAEDRPDDLLHAGYLGPLGENLTVGQDERDPVQREAKLRLDLFAAHLPDVFFNPHGYPMHEWVQPFSGYAAWVKKRDPKTRDWWIPRGAFIQTFQYADDEAEPAHRRIADDLRARLARAMDAEPAVRALNADQYARYERWAAFLPADLRLPRIENVLVYGPIRGVGEKKDAASFVQRAPKTCIANVILEVPDETARDEHLKTVCAAGRAVSRALAQFLRERAAMPAVKVTPFKDGATRVRARKRLE
jgi:hypothetical protein